MGKRKTLVGEIRKELTGDGRTTPETFIEGQLGLKKKKRY